MIITDSINFEAKHLTDFMQCLAEVKGIAHHSTDRKGDSVWVRLSGTWLAWQEIYKHFYLNLGVKEGHRLQRELDKFTTAHAECITNKAQDNE